ncbi:MAG TPA: glycosyltransferase [Caldilineaceae bacterium]|nr:glycosyltransferase [Caldilineaceae bacterium]
MRVVFFTHTFTPDYTGGAEVSLYHTCRGLQARGVECVVLNVAARHPHPGEGWYEVDGIAVRRVTLWTGKQRGHADLFDPRVFFAVRRELRKLRPDLLHVHNLARASLAPLVAARSARIPTVLTLHDLWLLCPNNMRYREDGTVCDPRRYPDGCGRCFRRYEYWADLPHRRRWMMALTRSVAALISPSQALIDHHVAVGYDPARFRLVPYGLAEPEPVPPTHAGVRKVCATAATRPTLAFAGGGVEIKGAQVVLAALPALLAAVPDLQLAVAGGGDPQRVQAYSAYAPAVQVLGSVPFLDMRALFGAADLTLVPSVWPENSPVVIYENFQVGTPVVGSAIGGIPELIDEGRTGYLFAPGDAGALAAKVAHHFSRPAWERRRMRQACAQKARCELSLARHLDGIQAVYAEALAAENG